MTQVFTKCLFGREFVDHCTVTDTDNQGSPLPDLPQTGSSSLVGEIGTGLSSCLVSRMQWYRDMELVFSNIRYTFPGFQNAGVSKGES